MAAKSIKRNYSKYPAKKSEKKSKEAKYIEASGSQVNEDEVSYVSAFTAARLHPGAVKSILAIAMPKPESKMTSFEKMNAMRFGISKKDLESLKLKTKLGYDKLAKLLSVTRATLINKKKQQKFNAALSERIISLADIYSYGYEVFEDEERFNTWMFKPNQALNGEAPYELMDNHFGREEVRNIIGRIEYGVYS